MTFLNPLTRKLVSRDPFWNVNPDLSSFLKAWEGAPFKGLEELRETTLAPKIDVLETDKTIEVKADMPGVSEKDIDVSLDQNILTLKGFRKEELEEKDGQKYHRIERHYGEYIRQLSVPEGIDVNAISAEFKDGVLKVILPKSVKDSEKRKVIAVKKA